ncbi:hypothetical protein [Fluviicoccus keumensis]|nr:hypothetical protein [Fluviicoccus keumensis]
MNEPFELPPLAVQAAALYLLNLLLLPGLAFAALLVLWWRNRLSASLLDRGHLANAVRGSLLAGAMLVGVTLLILLLGGFGQASTWVVLILYAVTVHAAFVLIGVLMLVRALAGQPFHFPLVGVKDES